MGDSPTDTGGILEIPETGESVRVSLFRIGIDPSASFEIAVQAGEIDDITRAIAQATFRIPPHFLVLPELVSPGSRVLDLGAHVGTFTLYAAALGYEVASVEASPRNVALLRLSLRRNGFERVSVFQAAATESDGTLGFVHAGPYGQVAREATGGRIQQVSGRRVDDLLKELGWANVALIKMDIEGSEPAALRGMPETLSGSSARAILFESNGHTLDLFGSTPGALIDELESFGYRCFEVTGAALVRRRPNDPQFECVTDCLAVKGSDPVLSGRRVLPGYSETELIERALREGQSKNPHVRAHVARTLVRSSRGFRADHRIEDLLMRLRRDSDEATRIEAGRMS